MMGHMLTGMPLLKKIGSTVNKTASTFLRSILPIRTETEEVYE
jgi:hypothetical protein